MRHTSRQKHLKHVHKSAHTRRMCYFRTVQSLTENNTSVDQSNTEQIIALDKDPKSPQK